MNIIKYLIEVEKYLYKYTLIGDNNLINFFKKEEKEIISNLSIEEAVVKLIRKANSRGGTDNISIAYLKKESGDL